VFDSMWPVLHSPWNFSNPEDIAVDDSGNVYIVDAGNNRIQKFGPNGEFITKWGNEGNGNGEFSWPRGIAIDGMGYVYVVDSGNNRVQKFNSNSEFITKWGTLGHGNSEFNNPSGISVSNNFDVYVSDTLNYRIKKFDKNSKFVLQWGSQGAEDGNFFIENDSNFQGIAVDDNGNVYVADSGNNRVQKFTQQGAFICKWGNKGYGNGEFIHPTHIETDSNNFVFVFDNDFLGSQRIQRFDINGVFLSSVNSVDLNNSVRINGLALDAMSNIYISDVYTGCVKKISTEGDLLLKWGTDGSGNGQFFKPAGIAKDNVGNIYVSDSLNHRIQKFSPDGEFLAKWGKCGGGNGEFVWPEGIAVDSNNFVFVADHDNFRIQKFTSNGVFINKWGNRGAKNGEFEFPAGIGTDALGNVYVSELQNCRIQKFSSNGDFISKWGSCGSGEGQFQYDNFLNIAISQDNLIYVLDTGNYRVQMFNLEGEYLSSWGFQGDSNGELNFTHHPPNGIVVDEEGHVYVVDGGNYCIKKFTSSGQFITKFGNRGNEQGGLGKPSYICIGIDKRVYVTDIENDRVIVFKPLNTSNQPERKNKAIIVAGGGPFIGNNIWDATEMCANYAYRALTYQGFTKDTIYYLSSDTDLDLDGNGIPDDVDADATNSNLNYAITTWAMDAEDLFIYMVDHGGKGTFRMGELELLKAEDLDTWLDSLQDTIPGNVTLVYDACRSGSFIPILDPPLGRERIIVTSASSDEEAIFGSRGTISFSFLFWARMFNGDSLYDSFYHATNSIGVTYPQNPLLEGNGNGIGNEKEDKDIVRVLTIGNETKSAGDIPVIGSVSPARTLDVETSALIYAENVIDADGISRVWAVITPPDYSPGSSDTPVTDLPVLELNSKGNNRYEGTYRTFTTAGTYTIAIYASDRGSVISLPKATTVTVSQGSAYGDVAPFGNRDGTVNVGDALVALRFALNLETPTQEDMEHGDVAPLDATGKPNPDGVINVGDALVILRKALGIISF